MRRHRSRLLAFVIAFAMVITSFGVTGLGVWAEEGGFASGSGTAEDPYVIQTAAQLRYLSETVNAGTDYKNQFIKLAGDIDLNNEAFTPIGGGEKLEDGSAKYKFAGTFDGAGKTIKGLNINAQPTEETQPNFTGLLALRG